jgi:hypothetical protein
VSEQVKAPWTEQQVWNLRKWQKSWNVLPFTNDECELDENQRRSLIPTIAGWITKKGGPVVQDWAWDYMLSGKFFQDEEMWHVEKYMSSDKPDAELLGWMLVCGSLLKFPLEEFVMQDESMAKAIAEEHNASIRRLFGEEL